MLTAMLTQVRYRLILIPLILLVLTGGIIVGVPIAGHLFDDFAGVQLARVMDTTVTRELRYVDRFENGDGIAGPPYAISFAVPEPWVYEVRTHINGPSLLFEYLINENEQRVGGDVAVPIFWVTALSSETYQQELEKPDDDLWFSGVLTHTTDTHFVWSLSTGPLSELPSEKIEMLQADVPAILESVLVTPLN